MIAVACPPAFVVAGVHPNGVYTCRARHEGAGLNDETWPDVSYPAFVHCAPGEIAWQPSLTTVACRRAP